MQTRIYAITPADGSGMRLIEATSQSQALRFVAEKSYTVEIAKPKDIARLMQAGAKIESAGDAAE